MFLYSGIISLLQLFAVVLLVVCLVGLTLANPWRSVRYRYHGYPGYYRYGVGRHVALHGPAYGGVYVAKNPGAVHIAPLYG